MKVYYLLHLGILILKRLSVETEESRILLAFDKIRDQLNHNLTPVEVDQYDSTTNILWNSVVLAEGVFVEVCSRARYEAQLADDTSLYNKL